MVIKYFPEDWNSNQQAIMLSAMHGELE